MWPRVLILARANPLWTQYYIEAFRRMADVRVMGPPITEEKRAAWFPHRTLPASVIPDIPVDFDAPVDLRQPLANFEPDLVVGISGLGGDPLPDNVSEFACPTAYITVDTWQCILNYPEARRYDHVFAAQREFVQRLNDVGARNVRWLPLACAPEHHYPLDIDPDFDLVFAGSLTADVHARRRAAVAATSKHFAVAVQERALGDDACRLYARGRLGLNHCAVDEINMRVFEVMAMRRPLLVNRGPVRNGLLDLFEDDRYLIVYNNEDDLVRKARRHLDDPARRCAVAEAGYTEVLAKHTYDHRAAEVLRIIESSAPKPWRDPERLADWLPHSPGRVLDVGMKLETSRYALRRMGACSVVGLSEDEAVRRSRRTSYDEMASWPPDGQFDSVVVSDASSVNRPLTEVLQAIAASTTPGSQLALHTEIGASDAHRAMRESNFHIVVSKQTTSGLLVVARRIVRTVRDVVYETFATHPEAGYAAAEIGARVPQDW